MKQKINKPLFFLIGFVILTVGVSLILSWWPDLVRFLKGTSGIVLALSGLTMMYFVKKL
jgi:cytochrome c biogenesis protein CcdA